MKPRIFTPAEEAEIVRRYSNGDLRAEIAAALHTRENLVKQVLGRHNIAIRGEHRDPNAVPLKTIPGMAPQLTRAERAANQHSRREVER